MSIWTRYRAALVCVGFQAVWLASALSAARGVSWPGGCVAIAFLLAVLALDGWPRGLMVAAAASAALGLVVEGALSASGLVRYGGAWPASWPAPLWIVLLWAAFATTLAPLRAMLGSRWMPAAAVLGLAAGPLAYLAGERLGALTIGQPPMVAYSVVAAVWCLALPLLISVSRLDESPSIEDRE